MTRKVSPSKTPAAPLPSTTRLQDAQAFAIAAARLCADRRCRDVRVINVAGISPITDFFILANANSSRQMKAICREVEEVAQEHKLAPLAAAQPSNDRWMAIDCVDVIVHLFSDEARAFYDLDSLWGDATEVRWTRD